MNRSPLMKTGEGMKALRMILLIFFLVTAGVYAGVTIKERMEADNEPPVIKAETDEITVSVKATDEELLEGMTASDNVDGDITNTLVVVSKSDFITKGTLKVNYAAFDSHNNVATYTRTVTYSDYRSPRFRADAPFHYVYSSGSKSMFSQVTVDDVLDGDITMNIRAIYGETDEGGTERPIVLQATNSAGDTSAISLTIYREDQSSYSRARPALTKYIVYTKVGNELDFRKYITGYYKNGKLYSFDEENVIKADEFTRDNILQNTSDVNINKAGEYVMKYTLYTTARNNRDSEELGSVELYVIVEE